jgi:hypothetical protein
MIAAQEKEVKEIEAWLAKHQPGTSAKSGADAHKH